MRKVLIFGDRTDESTRLVADRLLKAGYCVGIIRSLGDLENICEEYLPSAMILTGIDHNEVLEVVIEISKRKPGIPVLWRGPISWQEHVTAKERCPSIDIDTVESAVEIWVYSKLT